MNRRSSNIAVLSTLMIVISSSALSQETALWSGQAQCRLSVQSPAYVDQEIQTWVITGQPQIQGQLQIYPATWSVTGQGQRQDVQGTQTTTMRWSTNVPPMQAPLAIVVNSANQLIIKSYHAQMRVNNATTGSRQVSLFGIPQNPSAVAFTEFEYQFPSIQDFATRCAQWWNRPDAASWIEGDRGLSVAIRKWRTSHHAQSDRPCEPNSDRKGQYLAPSIPRHSGSTVGAQRI
jgi:hypothetical protein